MCNAIRQLQLAGSPQPTKISFAAKTRHVRLTDLHSFY